MLRAKIDMASPNINMRDPVLYRIRHAHHHRTGDAWCIYPMYDYAHPISDAIEGITHSLCTLEFEDHRPLYDWVLEIAGDAGASAADRVRAAEPHLHGDEQAQAAAARAGEARRRLGRSAHADASAAFAAAATRRSRSATSATRIGVAKTRERDRRRRCSSTACARISTGARRAPWPCSTRSSVVIENYPEGQVEEMDVVNNPEDPSAGTRKVPFSRVLYIEQDDFREDPPKKFFRLAPGREVRLRNAYLITCREVVKDACRADRRAALHVRPGDARRRRAGRPQGEGDAALGLGAARHRRRGAAVRSPLLRRESRRGRGEGLGGRS